MSDDLQEETGKSVMRRRLHGRSEKQSSIFSGSHHAELR